MSSRKYFDDDYTSSSSDLDGWVEVRNRKADYKERKRQERIESKKSVSGSSTPNSWDLIRNADDFDNADKQPNKEKQPSKPQKQQQKKKSKFADEDFDPNAVSGQMAELIERQAQQSKQKSKPSKAANKPKAATAQAPKATTKLHVELEKKFNEGLVRSAFKQSAKTYPDNEVIQLKDIAGQLELLLQGVAIPSGSLHDFDVPMKFVGESVQEFMFKKLNKYDPECLEHVIDFIFDNTFNQGRWNSDKFGLGSQIFLQAVLQSVKPRDIHSFVKKIKAKFMNESGTGYWSEHAFQVYVWSLAQLASSEPVELLRVWSTELVPILKEKKNGKDVQVVVHLGEFLVSNTSEYTSKTSKTAPIAPDALATIMRLAYSDRPYAEVLRKMYSFLIEYSVLYDPSSPRSYFAQVLSLLQTEKNKILIGEVLELLATSLSSDSHCYRAWQDAYVSNIVASGHLAEYLAQDETLNKFGSQLNREDLLSFIDAAQQLTRQVLSGENKKLRKRANPATNDQISESSEKLSQLRLKISRAKNVSGGSKKGGVSKGSRSSGGGFSAFFWIVTLALLVAAAGFFYAYNNDPLMRERVHEYLEEAQLLFELAKERLQELIEEVQKQWQQYHQQRAQSAATAATTKQQ